MQTEELTETYQTEREIIRDFLSQGEDLSFIQEVCSDPSLRLNQERVKEILERHTSLQKDNRFIYVPSINLYVAKERTCLGENWFDCHKLLQANNERMLILPEFIEFLKYCKINHQDIYKEITEVRNPQRAEWIDAYFKTNGKDLVINYNHILDSNGNLVPRSSNILDRDTLMKDKEPGISLEDYLDNSHTKQGLPNKKIKSGNLYYWYSRSDNNSVARFVADPEWVSLICSRIPSNQFSALGVRAVRRAS